MNNERIAALSEALPFVREFQGKTFVIKLGGELCAEPHLGRIAKQISLIHHIGIRVILVHGGGPQLSAELKKQGIESEIIAGRRVTSNEVLEVAKKVFAGTLSTDVVSALELHGARALGLTGVDARVVLAEKRKPVEMVNDGKRQTVDFQNVGDVKEINDKFLDLLLTNRTIPVIASLAGDKHGNVLNVNADTMAAILAVKCKASKLIVLSNIPGILRSVTDPSSLISYTDEAGIKEMIGSGVIKGGMLPKVNACLEALKAGVPRAHIIDGARDGALLLELFLNEGVGTMIVHQMMTESEAHKAA